MATREDTILAIDRRHMGRKLDVSDIIYAQGIDDLFDVHRTLIHKWCDRGIGFPEPLPATMTRTLVRSWSEVERWGKTTGRLDELGRPTT